MEKKDLNALGDVKAGAKNLAMQFRPLGMKPVKAKDLLIDDHDYSSPADHYFSYVNKRNTGYTYDDEKRDSDAVMKKLNLDEYLDPENKYMIFGLNEQLIQK